MLLTWIELKCYSPELKGKPYCIVPRAISKPIYTSKIETQMPEGIREREICITDSGHHSPWVECD